MLGSKFNHGSKRGQRRIIQLWIEALEGMHGANSVEISQSRTRTSIPRPSCKDCGIPITNTLTNRHSHSFAANSSSTATSIATSISCMTYVTATVTPLADTTTTITDDITLTLIMPCHYWNHHESVELIFIHTVRVLIQLTISRYNQSCSA